MSICIAHYAKTPLMQGHRESCGQRTLEEKSWKKKYGPQACTAGGYETELDGKEWSEVCGLDDKA